MQCIERKDAYEYEFAAKNPILTVEQGESFVVETEDASAGTIKSTSDIETVEKSPLRQATPPKGNPLAGPIFVQGAEPGDLLEVLIEQIEIDTHGFNCWWPETTPISTDARWPELNQPTIKIIEHQPGPSGTTRDGASFLNGKYLWDVEPMIGCFGVAPEREILTSSIGQSINGGNLDIRDVKEGTRIRMNVYHPGGLLFLGDVHASQGDTEYCGGADDTRADLQVSCQVIKNKRIPFIQLDLPKSIIAIRAGASLDVLVHKAVGDLIDWLVTDYGVSPGEAYTHVSANPDFRVNVYQYTVGLAAVGAQLPKQYL